MKVLVTGGAGFIGANLVRRLVEADLVGDVVVLDDLSSGTRDNLRGLDVELRVASILDADALDRACAGVDAVVHLAARPSVPRSVADPLASHEANATGTLQVLEAVRRAGNPHVIVASSSSVYGGVAPLPTSETAPPAPRSPYAASKLATEAYAFGHAASFGVPTLVFRFFNVFGPLQPASHAYAAVIPAFVSAALAGRALPIHGDGGQTRDFTFVGSVATVIADALARRVVHEGPVNLAFGTRRNLLDVVAELEALLGRELAREHEAPRAGDVRDSQADQRLLRELFPAVRPDDFREGLAATVAWMEAQERS